MIRDTSSVTEDTAAGGVTPQTLGADRIGRDPSPPARPEHETAARTLLVNGTAHPLRPTTTVADLVDGWCPSPDGVAVARNGEVVPRSEWTATPLEAGDRIEIVTAAAGG